MKMSCSRILLYSVLATGVGLAMLADHLGVPKMATTTAAASSAELVPVELVLLVDTSGSVDDTEYLLQKQGYQLAFQDDALGALIDQSGGIAVIYIEWSNVDHQNVRIDWTRLDTAADCEAYASQIATLTRTETGETMLAPALEFAANQLRTNNYSSLKRVIDVSGDGRGENYDYYLLNTEYSAYHGTKWDEVIADLTGTVNQVNGICITTDSGVVEFYRDVLPKGGGAFMMQVDNFNEFEEAILEKLYREISAIPGLFD